MQSTAKDLQRRSRALGWFSLALGLTELAAPKQLAHTLKIPADKTTTAILRAYGAREVLAGLGILSQPNKPR